MTSFDWGDYFKPTKDRPYLTWSSITRDQIWSNFTFNHNFTSYHQWTTNSSYASITVYSTMLKQIGNATCKYLTVVYFIYILITLNQLVHISEIPLHWKARAATTEYVLKTANFKRLSGNKFLLCSTRIVDDVVNVVPLNVPGNQRTVPWTLCSGEIVHLPSLEKLTKYFIPICIINSKIYGP